MTEKNPFGDVPKVSRPMLRVELVSHIPKVVVIVGDKKAELLGFGSVADFSVDTEFTMSVSAGTYKDTHKINMLKIPAHKFEERYLIDGGNVKLHLSNVPRPAAGGAGARPFTRYSVADQSVDVDAYFDSDSDSDGDGDNDGDGGSRPPAAAPAAPARSGARPRSGARSGARPRSGSGDGFKGEWVRIPRPVSAAAPAPPAAAELQNQDPGFVIDPGRQNVPKKKKKPGFLDKVKKAFIWDSLEGALNKLPPTQSAAPVRSAAAPVRSAAELGLGMQNDRRAQPRLMKVDRDSVDADRQRRNEEALERRQLREAEEEAKLADRERRNAIGNMRRRGGKRKTRRARRNRGKKTKKHRRNARKTQNKRRKGKRGTRKRK
jgi:hypothetical protein